jgi:hypothetical protein
MELTERMPSLPLQIVLVALVTIVVVAGVGPLLRSRAREEVLGQLLATLIRLGFTVLFAVLVAVIAPDHRGALIFSVGVAYFAAVLADGVLGFLRERHG